MFDEHVFELKVFYVIKKEILNQTIFDWKP